MIVSEYIEALQKLPSNLPVLCSESSGQYDFAYRPEVRTFHESIRLPGIFFSGSKSQSNDVDRYRDLLAVVLS